MLYDPENQVERVIVTDVQDQPGVLARVTMLLRRRGYNISTLAVGGSEKQGITRMTFAINCNPDSIEHVAKSLDKLIEVVSVRDVTEEQIVMRELALIKVECSRTQRSELLQIAQIYRAHTVDISEGGVTFEITGSSYKLDSIVRIFSGYGKIELTRTGRIALLRGNTNTKA